MSYQHFAKPTKDEFLPQDFAATLLLNAMVRKLNRRASIIEKVSVEYESLISDVDYFVFNGHQVYTHLKPHDRLMCEALFS